MHAKARNARSEFPQPMPSASYMAGAASGNVAAITERMMVVAARPEAAYIVYASTMYACVDIYSASECVVRRISHGMNLQKLMSSQNPRTRVQ